MASRRTPGEGSIYYDPTRQRWVGQAWVGTRRRKVSGSSRKAVADKLGKLVHTGVGEADSRITVGQLLDDWHAKSVPNRGLAPSTEDIHGWAVERWKAELGRQRAVTLRPDHVEAALCRMAAEGLGKSSLDKLRVTLKLAMAWAVKRRTLPHNPVVGVELPTGLQKTTRDRMALSADQADVLIDHLQDHPMGGLYLLMVCGGLRPGEAAGVTPGALHLPQRLVSVHQQVRRVRGRPVVTDQLKTHGSRRTVELDARAIGPLASACKGKGDSDLIFTTVKGGPLWNTTVATTLADILTKADLPLITPNELRHTCATLLSSVLLPHELADYLGHTSTRMVDRFYRHRPRVRLRRGVLGQDDGTPHLRAV